MAHGKSVLAGGAACGGWEGEEAGYSEGAILGNWLLQEAGGT